MHLYVMLRQQIFCIFARNPLRLQDAQAVEALRQKLRISPTILVHSDELQDGIVAAENGTRGSDLRSYVMFVRSSLLRFQKMFYFYFAKGGRYAIWLTKLNWVAQPPLTIRFQQLFVSVVRIRNWCSFQESLGTHRGIVAAGLWCCCLKFTARWGIAASRSRCGAVESTTSVLREKSSVDLSHKSVQRSKARGC